MLSDAATAILCPWRLIDFQQNFPEHQYPSIVGRPILRTEERDGGDIQLKDIMCGDEAAAARSMLHITYPVCWPSRTAQSGTS